MGPAHGRMLIFPSKEKNVIITVTSLTSSITRSPSPIHHHFMISRGEFIAPSCMNLTGHDRCRGKITEETSLETNMHIFIAPEICPKMVMVHCRCSICGMQLGPWARSLLGCTLDGWTWQCDRSGSVHVYESSWSYWQGTIFGEIHIACCSPLWTILISKELSLLDVRCNIIMHV